MIAYKEMEPRNLLPKDLVNNNAAFLDALNTIIHLQNNDSNYLNP